MIILIALAFGIFIGAITWIVQDTPDISTYKGSSESTMIYSADGQLLTKLFKENRIYVPIERIPKELKNAIIAIEDTNFYVHHGVDFWGIARAFVTNIIKGRLAQGASTITQQLARNALGLSFQKTIYRKIQEAYLALQFERLYTKPEILEMYLNEIFLGDINHNTYGVEAASQLYFEKHVWELSLSESALIAGLPKGSNIYSPLRNYEAAINRRNIVLKRMQELGYIAQENYNQASTEEIKLKESSPDKEQIAPYFMRYVRDKLLDLFGAQIVYGGGLKVYTTIDLEMQKKAEETIQEAIEEKYIPTIERNNTSDKIQPQLALVTIDPTNGEIRTMVGGRGNDHFNRAVQAVRQPGSAFKPFVYTTAIKQGYSTASILNDMTMLADSKNQASPSIWPTNYENKYRGLVSIRNALTHSINVAAVKMLQKVGVDKTIKTAEDLGISTFQTTDHEKDHLSLALGGLNKGVKAIEMASAYGVFANQGVLVEPYAIQKVLDNRNRVLFEAHPHKKIVLEEDVSYIMTDILRSVISSGTGWRANLDRPVAGKTGTTNNYTDAWFVGFTPDLVTSVWIGEDNLQSMVYKQKDENGNYLFPEGNGPRTVSSSEAARLWGNYMRKVVSDLPVSYFHKPDNIASSEIDPITGLLASEYTPKPYTEIFRKNNLPEEIDNLHGPVETVKIDKESGLLANKYCPEESIVEYDYIIDSGIRIGPATIKFEQKNMPEIDNNNKNEDIKKIKGSYLVNTGEPVQIIDPQTGVPVKNETGQIQYETKPDRYCDQHGYNNHFFDDIWDFFKPAD